MRQTPSQDQERHELQGLSGCWALLTLTTVGYGDMKARTNAQILYPIVAMGLAPELWGRHIAAAPPTNRASSCRASVREPTMGKSACAAWVLIWLGGLLGARRPCRECLTGGADCELISREINGTLFSAMTADTLRSMFGPPSAIEDPERRQEGQGTHIQYHALGLSFEMRQPRDQSPLQCWRVRIYLTKTWDAKAGMFFCPFRASLETGESGLDATTGSKQNFASGIHKVTLRNRPQRWCMRIRARRLLKKPTGCSIWTCWTSGLTFSMRKLQQRLHAIQLTLLRTVKPEPR